MAERSDIPLTPADVQRVVLARLRFERAMGMEVIPTAMARAARLAHAKNIPAVPAALSSAAANQTNPSKTAQPVIGNKEKRWQELEARARVCTQCALHSGRTQIVFGNGNRQADILFVGEGPGAEEENTGQPFMGPSGELLDNIMAAVGLKREDVYLCNAIKCRSPKSPPLPGDIAMCNPFLVEQIELVNPRVIVALGAPAAHTLLRTEQKIFDLRGHWHAYQGIPVMPTYHPAFLKFQYTPTNRKAVWDDMKQVVAKLKEEGRK